MGIGSAWSRSERAPPGGGRRVGSAEADSPPSRPADVGSGATAGAACHATCRQRGLLISRCGASRESALNLFSVPAYPGECAEMAIEVVEVALGGGALDE